MGELHVEAQNLAEAFKNLYFSNGRASILKYKPVQIPLIVAAVLILFTILFYLIAYSNNKVEYALVFTMSIFITALVLWWVYRKAWPWFKWKKNANATVRKMSGIKKAVITCHYATLEVQLDSQITINQWTNFSSVQLNDKYILLRNPGNEDLIFPAGSMTPEEFAQLTAIIREKLNKAEKA